MPNQLPHRLRSAVWWRAVAEHYGPSAAKVTSTLAFAFAIGIGLGVVLASGLDDSTDYDHARAHASDTSDGAAIFAPKAEPEPPYAIEVRVRENTQPAAAQLGDIFANVATEIGPAETPKAGNPSKPIQSETDASRESVLLVSKESATTTPPADEKPNLRPVAADAANDGPSAAKLDGDTSEGATAALVEPAPAPKTTNGQINVAVTAAVPVEDVADNAPAPLLPTSEDGDTVRKADGSVNAADDATAGGESGGAAHLTGRQLASLPGPRDATWLRHAVRTPREPGKAMIAIVIDDLGIDQKRTRRAIEMPGPMTMAFIPYGYNLPRLTKIARAGGHEILLHLPMEPLRQSVDPGPHAMLTTLSAEELRKRLIWNLARMEGYVGVNNHMGSRFTAWRPGMRLVMREIRERGLLFLDSWTNKRSYGIKLARENGVPSAVRDVFIDHDIDAAMIGKRLRQLETIARRRGFAIGIGHPYDLTTKLLPAWMAEAEARGIQFVPISTIVQRRMTAG